MHVFHKHCDNQIDLVRTSAEEVDCGATRPTFCLGSESTGALAEVYTVHADVPAMEPAKDEEFD
jgi:hypothetical protein